MFSINVTNVFMVGLGIIFQFVSFFFFLKILKKIRDSRIRLGWIVLLILNVCFVFGYGIFLIDTISENKLFDTEMLYRLVSFIFFFGAVFVIYVSKLFEETLSNLVNEKVKTRKLEAERAQKLTILNKELEEKIRKRTNKIEDSKVQLEKEVDKRTKELNEKVAELEKTNELMIGREIKMKELKERLEKT